MKIARWIAAACLIALSTNANAWTHGSSGGGFNGGLSEGQAYILNFGGDYPFINLLKTSIDWISPTPTAMDANGYPVGSSPAGFATTFNAPGQADRPGNQAITWLGSGQVGAFYQSGGVTSQSVAACAGTTVSNFACSNAACGSLTGSIAPGPSNNGVLTVTVAPGCSLVIGQPIAGFISQWDVPTSITGNASTNPSLCSPSCTGTGGTGTYAVNWSQTVSSGPINVGGYLELAPGTESNQWVTWELQIGASTSSNTVQHIAFLHKNDIATYAGGEIFGTLFKKRISHFGVWRNLDWSFGNASDCTTWATRKPITYYSYGATEFRANLYAGNLSYTLNGSSNDYSVTFGSGAPTPHQTIIATVQNAATNTTLTLNLNGAGAKPMLSPQFNSAFPDTSFNPGVGQTVTFVYDENWNGTGAWLTFGAQAGRGGQTNYGLQCGVPTEVFLQLTKEIGAHPWLVRPYLSVDPMTDWTKQEAAYVKANQSSWQIPRFEITNETWNCNSPIGGYANNKAFAHWGNTGSGGFCPTALGTGDLVNWMGMVGSTVGQDVATAYGGFSTTKYKVITGVKTDQGIPIPSGPQQFNDVMNSTQWVNNGPAQSGYTQSAAKGWITSICVAPYWSPIQIGTGAEIAAAFNYSVAPSESILQSYVGTEPQTGYPLSYGSGFFANWSAWEAGFGVTQMEAYEGDFNLGDTPAVGGDSQIGIPGATNAASAVITLNSNNSFTGSQTGSVLTTTGTGVSANLIPGDLVVGGTEPTGQTIVYQQTGTGGGNGNYAVSQSGSFSGSMKTYPPMVVGMTVSFVLANGGTWSSIVGNNFTVTAVDQLGHFTINLNSTSLGTFTSGIIQIMGSGAQINTMRTATYSSPSVGTKNIAVYNAFTSNGGEFPSMYVMASASTTALGLSWSHWLFDIYGATHSASDPGTPNWQAICTYNGGASC